MSSFVNSVSLNYFLRGFLSTFLVAMLFWNVWQPGGNEETILHTSDDLMAVADGMPPNILYFSFDMIGGMFNQRICAHRALSLAGRLAVHLNNERSYGGGWYVVVLLPQVLADAILDMKSGQFDQERQAKYPRRPFSHFFDVKKLQELMHQRHWKVLLTETKPAWFDQHRKELALEVNVEADGLHSCIDIVDNELFHATTATATTTSSLSSPPPSLSLSLLGIQDHGLPWLIELLASPFAIAPISTTNFHAFQLLGPKLEGKWPWFFNACADEGFAFPAKEIAFAPHWQTDIIQPLVQRLEKGGSGGFVGLHLRVEADMQYVCANKLQHRDTCTIYSPTRMHQCFLHLLASKQLLPQQQQQPQITNIYVATGEAVLNSVKFAQWREQMKDHFQLFFKSELMPAEDLDKYGREELAIIESEVLLQSNTFVGFSWSTLSSEVAALRNQLSSSASSSILYNDECKEKTQETNPEDVNWIG